MVFIYEIIKDCPQTSQLSWFKFVDWNHLVLSHALSMDLSGEMVDALKGRGCNDCAKLLSIAGRSEHTCGTEAK